jgi:hypothetical protein
MPQNDARTVWLSLPEHLRHESRQALKRRPHLAQSQQAHCAAKCDVAVPHPHEGGRQLNPQLNQPRAIVFRGYRFGFDFAFAGVCWMKRK